MLHLWVERQNNAATLTVLTREEIAETLGEEGLRLAIQDIFSRSFHPGGLREGRREIAGRVRVERTLGIRALVARGSFNLFGGRNRSAINNDRAAIGFSSVQNRALIAAISVQRRGLNDLIISHHQTEGREHHEHNDKKATNLSIHARPPMCSGA